MLLLIIILLLLFGGGGYWGFQRWGPPGGIGIGGLVLLILVLYLLFGGGLGSDACTVHRHAITIGSMLL